jgi:ribonucleoside-diphosphate reductase alpha chain
MRLKFSFEEAYQDSLDYFCGDKFAAKIFVSKYALRDAQGNIYEKTPEDMHRRLAREIGRIEKNYPTPITEETLFYLFDRFKYLIPQGSPMAGIGNNYQITSLSNCFVIGLDGHADSYGAIIKIDEEQVQLMKRRGGVGHDLSHIRPDGSVVSNSALTSTGILPFMERYSNSTREVAQGGRRGALMLSVSIEHPDAELFIDAKMKENKITGANVSVKITDEFMKAVISNSMFTQRFPVESNDPIYTREVRARNLWEKIIYNAWKSAEPGVLFWDTILKESVPDCYADLGFRTISTNPCGEIPLCSYDSCRLLSINLFSYVNNPFTEKAQFDFELFKSHAKIALRIMDDIIDLELEKIDSILTKINLDPELCDIKCTEERLWGKIRQKTVLGRRAGVGITGEGDMLASLGYCYGSEESISFVEQVHKILALSVYRSSVDLAKDRGSFKIFDFRREKNNPFINRLKIADPNLFEDMSKYGRRNIACLTIAPTGTTSLMTQTTSGIEPVFSPVYKRRRKVNPSDMAANISFIDELGDSWEEYTIFHHKFAYWMKIKGYPIKKDYTQKEIDDLILRSPYYKATSNDIDWVQKVKMQGHIQRWVDHSISVTINLPSDTNLDLVGKLYMEAWKLGCKGCTIYRYGSRNGILVSASKNEKDLKKTFSLPVVVSKRPRKLEADVVRFQNNKEKWIAFVGLLDKHPYEIFTGINDEEIGIFLPKNILKGIVIKNIDVNGNKRYDFQYVNKRGCKTTIEGLSTKFNPEYWNYAKLISGVLRYGMPVEQVVELVQSLHFNDSSINTWRNGVERALKKYIGIGTEISGKKCPNCGQKSLIYQEGCVKCISCGNSRCE